MMLYAAVTVARKELLDHLRDSRALVSTGLYALMGPAVVWLVLMAVPDTGDGSTRTQLLMAVMAAVFTLVAAFTGGMSVTMDMIAGERERRSLLPLLVNAVPRVEIVIGKWLAAGIFAMGGLCITLLGFLSVFAWSPAIPVAGTGLLWVVPPLATLCLFAAALELLVSAKCSNVKEANTYLSLLMFVVMGIGMWLAFRSGSDEGWLDFIPVLGQQHLLELMFAGGRPSLLVSAGLSVTSFVTAVLALAHSGQLFQRDAIIYGD